MLNYLNHFQSKAAAALDRKITAGESRIASVMKLQCMRNPMSFTENKSRQLDDVVSRMEKAVNERLNACESDLREVASKLAALNPLAVLARGYCVTYREGQPVSSVNSIHEGDKISIQFTDGSADCRVERIFTEDLNQHEQNNKKAREL